jgi:hypothetical protein
MLGQFGITGAAAEAYADELGLIPGNVSTAASFNDDQASREISAFIAKVNSIPSSRTVTIYSKVTGQSVSGSDVFHKPQANGSVLDFYGQGGIREQHVAQIAPAGAWRVWAEPETGGEAYIPLAAAKRQRSLAIWEETGKRLGVQGFADGGLVRPQYAQPAYAYGMNGPGIGGTTVNNFNMQPIRDNDPQTTAEIVGRAFGRQVAG